MKTKNFIIVCLLACLCLPQCGKDDKEKEEPVVVITGISIPSSVADLAINGTADVTATVTPAAATDDVVWSSSDPSVATVVAKAGTKGREATITGIKDGTTQILAKNASGSVSSQALSVTVTPDAPPPPPDYAAVMAGTYYGEGTLTNVLGMAGLPSSGPVNDVVLTMTRVDNTTMSFTMIANIPTLKNEEDGNDHTLTGTLEIEEGYSFTGETGIHVPGIPEAFPDPFPCSITGQYDNGTIEITVSGAGVIIIEIELGPTPPAPDYASDVVGTYLGEGELTATGLVADMIDDGPVEDVVITLSKVSNTKVNFVFEAIIESLGGEQLLEAELTVNADYELTGTTSMEIDGSPINPVPFEITGQVNPDDQTIELAISALGGMVLIEITAEIEEE